MSAFEKLAPFIQDYIYRNKWHELRGVQEAAADVIFNTGKHLLIATPTASGKTEAAFFPVITDIYNDPPRGVAALYIAPLKALINDQFSRMGALLEEAYIPVTKWHADAPPSRKNGLLKNPRGILQITPESLEALCMRRPRRIAPLFSRTRFIVVDEVHAFLGSDRGAQLSSLLERIGRMAGNAPRRIGLSATLGDVRAACEWLSGGAGRPCAVADGGARRPARVMLEHFYVLPEETDPEEISRRPYFETLYDLTKGKKSVIFANSRAEVERNIVNLKETAARRGEEDVFLTHHGSISASNREYAEEQMKSSGRPLVAGATLTLELGIDLGGVDRIAQTGCPHSVSSLAQRLGRAGRRGGTAEMFFLFDEEKKSKKGPFYRNVNWLFIKCVALIELYRERGIEAAETDRYPFGVLYHQTMSFLYGRGGAAPAFLAQYMLSLDIFKHITQDDYKLLLRAMLEKEHIEKAENGALLIGPRGEVSANRHDFYAVFETPVEYSVREGAYEIGMLDKSLPPGTAFTLAGKTWLAIDIDEDQKIIYVEAALGRRPAAWDGTYNIFEYTKTLQKMRAVLASCEDYPYMRPAARARLSEIRRVVRRSNILESGIYEITPSMFALFPWLGTKAYNALDFALSAALPARAYEYSYWPALVVKNVSRAALSRALKKIISEPLSTDGLKLPEKIPPAGKYGDIVPPDLRRKQFIGRFIDIDEMRRECPESFLAF